MEQHQLKIAHMADLHLGSLFKTLPDTLQDRLKEEQRQYLSRFAKACMEEEVDLILLAGDIFDRPDPEPIWITRFLQMLEQVKPIPVYIVPGNHDPYYKGSIWDRLDWPEHVSVFKAATTFVNESLKLLVSGSPFTSVSAGQTVEEVEESTISHSEEWIRIHMLHGDLVAGQVSASLYNPIQERDPRFDHYDYIALGHVHLARVLERQNSRKTVIRYPGCPQGRAFDELGDKGFYLQTITREKDYSGRWQTSHYASFRSLGAICFQIDRLDISSAKDFASLNGLLIDYVQTFQEEIRSKRCIRLILEGRVARDLVIDTKSLEDLLAHYDFAHVEIQDETLPRWPLEKLRQESGFFGVLVRDVDQEIETINRNRASEEDKSLAKALLEEALNLVLTVGEAGSED